MLSSLRFVALLPLLAVATLAYSPEELDSLREWSTKPDSFTKTLGKTTFYSLTQETTKTTVVYVRGKFLGKGDSGVVYAADRLEVGGAGEGGGDGDAAVALKIARSTHGSDSALKSGLRETRNLRGLGYLLASKFHSDDDEGIAWTMPLVRGPDFETMYGKHHARWQANDGAMLKTVTFRALVNTLGFMFSKLFDHSDLHMENLKFTSYDVVTGVPEDSTAAVAAIDFGDGGFLEAGRDHKRVLIERIDKSLNAIRNGRGTDRKKGTIPKPPLLNNLVRFEALRRDIYVAIRSRYAGQGARLVLSPYDENDKGEPESTAPKPTPTINAVQTAGSDALAGIRSLTGNVSTTPVVVDPRIEIALLASSSNSQSGAEHWVFLCSAAALLLASVGL